MPWVLYRETEHDAGNYDYTETEVLAVVDDPNIVRTAIPDEKVGSHWTRSDEAHCHHWEWSPTEYTDTEGAWLYRALYSSWQYILREFQMNDLGKVER